MNTAGQVLILAFSLAAALLIALWHITIGLGHLALSIVHVLYHAPALLLVLAALIAMWIVFLR